MPNDFADIRKWLANIEHAVDGSATRRILNKAGAAGKKVALDAAAESLGGDRRFSHWMRGPALSAGYDPAGPSQVVIKFRGPWKLAESGRSSSGRIRPRRRRAVLTPAGPRARSSYGTSRGMHTYSNASRKARTTVPQAAHDQFVAEIRRVL